MVKTKKRRKVEDKVVELESEAAEYEVEKIVDKNVDQGVVIHLVKWKGWEDPKDFTWEPIANLKGSEKLLKVFEKP